MTTEEKAKAYDKILKVAEDMLNHTVENYICKDFDKENLRTLLGQLLPELTESEDERIRKEMIEFLNQYKEDGLRGVDITPWIAYLEKQKEQKPTEWSEETQKDIDDAAEYLRDYANNFVQGGNSKRYVLDLADRIEPLTPKSKQEWSEEDSDNLERADNYLWMLDNYVGDDCAMPQGKTDKIRGNIQEVLSPWLKSLPERFNLQPKQEWSEEDESNLQWIISCVKGTNVYTSQELAKELTKWLKNKLKVLRPQPHTVSVKDATKFGNLEYERGVKDGIQSEKNHQWKPSKDQIKALTNLIKGTYPYIVPTDLSELLAKLKQLYYNE